MLFYFKCNKFKTFYFRNSSTFPFMHEKLGPERIQQILSGGQRSHPRRDEIADEGVVHFKHGLKCTICIY